MEFRPKKKGNVLVGIQGWHQSFPQHRSTRQLAGQRQEF